MMRKILAAIMRAVMGVLLFPFEFLGDAWHALWRPRAIAGGGNGAGDQETAGAAANRTVQAAKASGAEPDVDRLAEIRRVAGRLAAEKTVEGAKLSRPVLEALAALRKDDLRKLAPATDLEVARFCAQALNNGPKPVAPAREAEVVSMPGLAARIAVLNVARGMSHEPTDDPEVVLREIQAAARYAAKRAAG